MRQGKPCSIGSVWPFIATASMDCLPSRTDSVGVPMVMPSMDVDRIWSAPLCTPARRSSGASGVPSQRALPQYEPPTGFETQVSVRSCSSSGIRSRSSKLISNGRSTIPWIFSIHWLGSTCGIESAVSTR
jgi:hypothetical protein